MSRLEIDETLLSNSRDVYQYKRYQKFNCRTNGGSVDSETIIGVQAGKQALLTLMSVSDNRALITVNIYSLN